LLSMRGMKRLILVRAGATRVDRERVLTGIGDPPLTDAGIRRMEELRRHWEWVDHIVASPWRRTRDSAQLLARGGPVVLELDFRPRNCGRWEGRSFEELRAADPGSFEAWRADPDRFEFPDGEPRAHFESRVARGLCHLRSAPLASALVVTHAEVIRRMVALLTGSSLPDGRPGPGEMVLLTRRDDGEFRLGRRSSDPDALRSPLEREGLSGTDAWGPERHVGELELARE
jgi:alpha-ribazole phosphatase